MQCRQSVTTGYRRVYLRARCVKLLHQLLPLADRCAAIQADKLVAPLTAQRGKQVQGLGVVADNHHPAHMATKHHALLHFICFAGPC